MIIKERFIKTLEIIGAAAILMAPLAGCGAKKNLEAGATWEVAATAYQP